MSEPSRTAGANLRKILVIEDDIVVRDVIAATLRSQGYVPIAADNGRQGIASFKSEEPALVITDILMPEKEGIETILELRRLRPEAKILAISGGRKDFLDMAARLGASAVLTKPFRPAELLDTVARLLG